MHFSHNSQSACRGYASLGVRVSQSTKLSEVHQSCNRSSYPGRTIICSSETSGRQHRESNCPWHRRLGILQDTGSDHPGLHTAMCFISLTDMENNIQAEMWRLWGKKMALLTLKTGIEQKASVVFPYFSRLCVLQSATPSHQGITDINVKWMLPMWPQHMAS